MKLRNKKTGKIWHMPRLRHPTIQEDDISFFAYIGEHGCSMGELFSYKSIAELNEEWEDVEPLEPLIKDEKIRKAVRAWAIANDLTCCRYECGEFEQEYAEMCAGISFGEKTDYLEERRYTIAELCGEEEE
jgi:hypothetical protein